jgi:hypothetical protein
VREVRESNVELGRKMWRREKNVGGLRAKI